MDVTEGGRSAVSPWGVERLDLEGYLRRVGQPAAPPSRTALDALHEAHVRTFSFDNVDVLTGRHPGVGLEAVQGKFVGRGRGGYCFEHVTLFAAVLERLGYAVERRLGRVGDPERAPRTHAVVVIDLDGELLLGDPGIGMGPLFPIRLGDGVHDDRSGWGFRLAERSAGPVRLWQLQRHRDGGWGTMHTHDELPVDVAYGHYCTSTHPASHFTTGLMLTRHAPGSHTTLTHRTLTVRRPGQPSEQRAIGLDEVRELVPALEPALTADELDVLMARLHDIERHTTAW